MNSLVVKALGTVEYIAHKIKQSFRFLLYVKHSLDIIANNAFFKEDLCDFSSVNLDWFGSSFALSI